ncbi:MAG TPA: GFA family protein [Burkholderiales bacterium]|nr:GFA family protein [Burkholderiales bacterium]
MQTFEGGCLCGAIRYRASGEPVNQSYCHCTMCRRSAGAPVVSWLTMAAEGFAFTQGQPARYDSSDIAYREFCPRCGTQLTYRARAKPHEVDITSASLDEPERAPPKDHIWTRSHIRWFEVADELPRHERERVPR